MGSGEGGGQRNKVLEQSKGRRRQDGGSFGGEDCLQVKAQIGNEATLGHGEALKFGNHQQCRGRSKEKRAVNLSQVREECVCVCVCVGAGCVMKGVVCS